MDRKNRINSEVEKTLELLDKLENIEPNPFLYTRIKVKIDEFNTKPIWLQDLSLTDIIKSAFIVILVLINIYSLIVFSQQNTTAYNTMQKYLDTLLYEYTPSTTIDYFNNNLMD